MDDARSEYDSELTVISDRLTSAATLEDAIGACLELRYVLDKIKDGVTAAFLIDPHENDGRWEVVLHQGIDDALAAIANILATEHDLVSISQRLQLPLAIARYTISQTSRMMRP